jgi:hypothetical protein
MMGIDRALVDFLEAVGRGDISLTPKCARPMDCIHPVYFASNGWKICIFNDCGDWDYIDYIEADGVTYDYGDIRSRYPMTYQYSPSTEVSQSVYKLELGGEYYGCETC